MRTEGHDVLLTREPGATDVGSQIRTLLLAAGPMGMALVAPRSEALLYAADRAHHVATVIRPALDRGAVVISERYIDSSLAYQEAGRTLPVDEVAWLSGWATAGLKPDLVVLLDIDPTEGLARADHRPADAAAADPQAVHFAERVRYAFLDLSAKDPNRYLVLDASRPPDAVAALIADRVDHLLPTAPRHRAPDHHTPGGEGPDDGEGPPAPASPLPPMITDALSPAEN